MPLAVDGAEPAGEDDTLRRELRRVFGTDAVLDTSAYPDFVDLVICVRSRVLLGECKTPRNRSGTVTQSQIKDSQRALLASWGSDVVLMLTSPEQAVAAVTEALRT